jgi:RNA polymerase sigma-54 factor
VRIAVLELRNDFVTTAGQLPTVNCQIIVRSELLELSCLDLISRIQQEAEENPALELECRLPLEELPTVPVSHSARRRPADPGFDPTSVAPSQHELRDELHRRIGWVSAGAQREIACWLIECIDERGYLATTLLEAALDLGVELAEVEAALRVLQRVAPAGVGARNLRECLLLQMDALADVPEQARLVAEHCQGLMTGEGLNALGEGLGITSAELREGLAFIRAHLTPYPGEQFRPDWHHLLPGNPHATCPDVLLSLGGDAVEVELTTARALDLRVAGAYRRLDEQMRQLGARSEDDAMTRAREQVRSAQRLIWSLEQRERSLYRIAQAIVRQQHDFILHGPLEHRPLTHKRIAELTGLHESTVSRATAGKLVRMPSGESVSFGVFFDDALPAKTVLRGIVAAEPAESPLTDDDLQEALATEGFEVARRTVNKYRRALGIPSSADRRRSYLAA